MFCLDARIADTTTSSAVPPGEKPTSISPVAGTDNEARAFVAIVTVDNTCSPAETTPLIVGVIIGSISLPINQTTARTATNKPLLNNLSIYLPHFNLSFRLKSHHKQRVCHATTLLKRNNKNNSVSRSPACA